MRQREAEPIRHSTTFLIRWMVGGVFVAEGAQKILFPDVWGSGGLLGLGISGAEVATPLMGVLEIVCGVLLIIGLVARIAALILLVDIGLTIVTSKIPILLRQGFWSTLHETTTEYCLLLGLIFLLVSQRHDAT
jgi:putative oxidoreductase